MEADGDPATFSMTVQCLKSESGSMVKLVKYNIGTNESATSKNKGVASVLDAYDDYTNDDWATPASKATKPSQNDPDYIIGE